MSKLLDEDQFAQVVDTCDLILNTLRQMAPDQTRKHFSKMVENAGGVSAVAVQLNCSATMISQITKGRRRPGMDLSRAIEELFKIPMQAWVEAPKFETVQRIVAK